MRNAMTLLKRQEAHSNFVYATQYIMRSIFRKLTLLRQCRMDLNMFVVIKVSIINQSTSVLWGSALK